MCVCVCVCVCVCGSGVAATPASQVLAGPLILPYQKNYAVSRVPVPVPENFKLGCRLPVPEGKMLGCRLGNSPLNSMINRLELAAVSCIVDKQEASQGG